MKRRIDFRRTDTEEQELSNILDQALNDSNVLDQYGLDVLDQLKDTKVEQSADEEEGVEGNEKATAVKNDDSGIYLKRRAG